MEKVIRELEIRKNKSLEYVKEGDTYHAGAYKAYHKQLSLSKELNVIKTRWWANGF